MCLSKPGNQVNQPQISLLFFGNFSVIRYFHLKKITYRKV